MAEPFTTAGLAKKLIDANLGTKAEAMRIIQHYTSEGLLVTEGAVNTGTGKRRIYPASAFIRAAILFRMNRLSVPAGVIKELVLGLDQWVRKTYSLELEAACKKIEDPCLVLGIPGGPGEPKSAHLASASQAYRKGFGDVIIIDLRSYLSDVVEPRKV